MVPTEENGSFKFDALISLWEVIRVLDWHLNPLLVIFWDENGLIKPNLALIEFDLVWDKDLIPKSSKPLSWFIKNCLNWIIHLPMQSSSK